MKVGSQSYGITKCKKSKWIMLWFVSSEFKWLWLVAGNRYLQCDGLQGVSVLDEVGGLTIRGRVGGLYKMSLKRVRWKTGVGKQKYLKRGICWVKG